VAYEQLVRSHVERCLQDIWEVEGGPEFDDEGDYPFRTGSCLGWVRVEPQPPILVRVFAHVAYDVKRSAALLQELNALNVRSRLATLCWADRTVAVHSALPVEALDRANLRLVLDTVTKVADDISELIAAVFGGRVPWPAQESAES
jgi:hypothetical protein